MWNLEGLTVRGEYFGIPVEGIVTMSRVKYGGSVQHTVDLFFPITVFGDERTTVLLDADEVTYIEYESVTACEFD
jgi:predicted RNA-binding protein associated with RNAse of E/G family